MKARYLFLSVLAAAALPIPAADASVLLIFGQTGTGDTVTGTRTGTSTTITSSTSVDIDEIDATVVTPILATFTLSATNSGPATSSGGEITQHYNGTFSITNGATNYLSGTFSDASFGSGGALTQSASNPSSTQSVSFTSNVIAPSLIGAFDRAMSLSFTDVSPSAAIIPAHRHASLVHIRCQRQFQLHGAGALHRAMMLLGFAGVGQLRVSQGPRPLNLDRLIANRYSKGRFRAAFSFRALKNSTSSRAGLSTPKPWSRAGPRASYPRGAGFFLAAFASITPISPHLLEGCGANDETGRPDRDGRGLGGVASVLDDALVLRTADNRALPASRTADLRSRGWDARPTSSEAEAAYVTRCSIPTSYGSQSLIVGKIVSVHNQLVALANELTTVRPTVRLGIQRWRGILVVRPSTYWSRTLPGLRGRFISCYVKFTFKSWQHGLLALRFAKDLTRDQNCIGSTLT